MVWLLLDVAGVAVPGRGEVKAPLQAGIGVLGCGLGISCLQSGWSTANSSCDPSEGGLQALEAAPCPSCPPGSCGSTGEQPAQTFLSKQHSA